MSRAIALLANPSAGGGRALAAREAAAGRLRDAGLDCVLLTGADAAGTTHLARQAVADGVDAVVAVGGDGTVHAAVQALAGTGVALGTVPCGTGNDVARYLGIPRDDPVAAADRVVAARTRRIDLARSGATYFVTVLAAGFDALVNERANGMRRPRGRSRYTLATLAELRTFTPRDYVLDLDGVARRTPAMLVAVGNGPSFGGGLRITEGAVLDDGLLDVVVIRPMSRAGLVRTYPTLYRGTHTGHPAYERHRVRRVTLAAPGIVAYADGERFGPLPLTVECAPGALEVLA
ncbi:YegS/Rv2252/BmrU family lipid kinase [uncultured Nocardioides sp.]|uniref:diacylglycerol/lipid kinase family protein n=1 Tax=uncultured Nocardioides sp. TaxID=198441 RepID=UPI00260AF099|nr:YegS/Rv2252/BmrU family lipid kinase [uncultured Nocardioides sp.]